MNHSQIAGLGTALPEKIVTNDELARRLDVEPYWIETRTGIRERRIASETETTTLLGTIASAQALRDAGLSTGDLDAIVVATITPDMTFPTTACSIQHQLGAPPIPSLDISAGCSGFLYALWLARNLVATTAEHVLVVGVDVLSRVTDPSDVSTSILFGDGAGAAIVSRSRSIGLGAFELGADGSQPDVLCLPADTGMIRMDGREVYRRAVSAMANSVASLLSSQGLGVADIDLLVAHQANARILTAVAERLQIDEGRLFSNITVHGNTSAASIPIALAEASESGRLQTDDRVVLTAFGAGFTWGSALVQWTKADLSSENTRVGAARA